MTQTQIEQTRVIAEYDGWELIGEPEYNPPFKCYHKGIKVIPVINPQGEEYDDWTTYMPYLIDLNALHKVIKQIRSEFRENHPPLDNAVEMYKQLGNALYDAFDSDNYEDLFNAVYEGIVFLNQNKTTPQERG
jgi:hypothetical protein